MHVEDFPPVPACKRGEVDHRAAGFEPAHPAENWRFRSPFALFPPDPQPLHQIAMFKSRDDHLFLNGLRFQFLGAELCFVRGEPAFPEAEIQERNAGRLQYLQRAINAVLRHTVICPVFTDELPLARYLKGEIGGYPFDFGTAGA